MNSLWYPSWGILPDKNYISRCSRIIPSAQAKHITLHLWARQGVRCFWKWSKVKTYRAGRSQELIKGTSILEHVPRTQPCPLMSLWALSPVLSCCVCLQDTSAPSSKCLKIQHEVTAQPWECWWQRAVALTWVLVGFFCHPCSATWHFLQKSSWIGFNFCFFPWLFHFFSFVSTIRLHY